MTTKTKYPNASPANRRALLAATSLEDLVGLFGDLDDRTVAELPTFGGEEPRSTSEVWSWDTTRLLVGTCASDLRIVDREDWRR